VPWLAHPAATPASTTPVTAFAAQSRMRSSLLVTTAQGNSSRASHLFSGYR
jgi:hypothetical protein